MTTTPLAALELLSTGGELRIADVTFTGDSSYPDVLEWLSRQARSQGAPVLVHSVERPSGQESWFSVDHDGSVHPAGPSSPSPERAAPAPAPTTAVSRSTTAPAPVAVDPLPRRADVRFVKPAKPRPRTGLRAAVYAATGGVVNLGQSALERETDELARRISRKLTGSHSTAILSLKGGVGKTSTTGGVGMMLAEYRGDPPCAVDMNPDSGDLAERVVGEAAYDVATAPTVTDVVRDAEAIGSLTELGRYMHHANRLHVIAGEQDPEVSDALTADDHARVQALVARYYSVVLTDCGTGVSHPAMAGILRSVSNVVIVTDWAVSAADRAARAIGWLREHGYTHLAESAIVVITDMADVPEEVDRAAIARFLEVSSAQLIQVPRDRAAAGGVQIVPERVSPATRLAWMRIAAAIVDGYR
ncbi:MinD/ParA family ATP-binding protein [Clavibacter michiganensis]|uniref:MinD/ParA family ATP-binding protein n=1 Tax=Clavibacter michiganensis TaxID=28447 RepID=UPI000B8FE3CC|nr:MinD/ParA family protein [Clavibacter michiganensis]MBE3077020.1 MinD/ParA family protein [Clavibacter michiganensis subsp. michiganensis]MDO4101054.1 MinD/ParA family protein [Clavibacter michiganensis]MDO4125917.1 MinD/ParA family protein [Clavibacter michiganensis]MDO4128923.1 MinD/ParA family protein [Clavibacter michiganensis]MDO4141120.1 MinD/ParA family protein [Clavibacter michiganensis]